ncbi:MAG: cytochrome C oxidase subunit IV family protein [Pirellulaceae bacterium]|nr:cytochrome C oxidase subunit IV family protein [Pirellulaceae bacterium]
MADHTHAPAGEDDLHEHHAPGGLMKYLAVFGALLVLTAISFAVGNSQSLRENSPQVMWAMMMAVSCAKALLVIMFFMHLMWEANWKYVLTIPASMMSIFLLLMLVPDIGRRTQKYAEERWLHAAEPQAAHHDHAPAAGHKGDTHGHEPGKPAAPADGH